MTEEVIDSGIVEDQSGSLDVGSSQIDQQPSQQSHADMVSKQRVNEIVQERTRQAAQKAYERGLAEAAQKQQSVSSMGGMSQHSDADLRRMMQEEFNAQHEKLQKDFQQQEVRKQVDQMTNDYIGKLNAS